jgi:hypothetical protein
VWLGKKDEGNVFVILVWKRLEKYPYEGQTFYLLGQLQGYLLVVLKDIQDDREGGNMLCYGSTVLVGLELLVEVSEITITLTTLVLLCGPLTTHITCKRQTFMTLSAFEPAIPTVERPQTYALDRATTGIGPKRVGEVK